MRRALEPGLEVGEHSRRGADLWVRRRPRGAKLLVELKATESPEPAATGEPFWAFHAHGKAKNGKKHSLWTQCQASGAQILVLASRRGTTGRWCFMVVHLGGLRTAQRRALQLRTLKGRIADLAETFECSPVGSARLLGEVAERLP